MQAFQPIRVLISVLDAGLKLLGALVSAASGIL
jgi:hypothetical protein